MKRSALTHFRRCLPSAVERWVVAFEPTYHGAIARALAQQINIEDVIELGVTPPDRVRAIAEEKKSDPACGFLEFAVIDGEALHGGLDYRDALNHFTRWSMERVRLCFDVIDANFDELFDEDPSAVLEHCRELRGLLADLPNLRYCSEAGSALELHCDPSRWRIHSGLEPDDYLLPSGEIECVPLSVDGELIVDGWLIGTIPFGPKFGRIHGGQLILNIEKGRIVEVGGTYPLLRDDFEKALANEPELRHVVELGIGQSKAVVGAATSHEVGCVWHERHWGLHLGLGAAMVETSEGELKSGHHLDFVMRSGQLSAGGDTILSW